MKVALAAQPFKNGDVQFNRQVILNTLAECAGRADFVVFGEAVLQGFDGLKWVIHDDMQIAVDENDESIRMIQRAASLHRIAVSFGAYEKENGCIYSSQFVIDKDGDLVHRYRRVSVGWKEPDAASPYREGESFTRFRLEDRTWSVALCGDLWYEENAEHLRTLSADVVLWPVYCDYSVEKWNDEEKMAYAEQAAKTKSKVLLVNPFCIKEGSGERACGGAACFEDGIITADLPAGDPGILIVDI